VIQEPEDPCSPFSWKQQFDAYTSIQIADGILPPGDSDGKLAIVAGAVMDCGDYPATQ
jgi:hypothetical protein